MVVAKRNELNISWHAYRLSGSWSKGVKHAIVTKFSNADSPTWKISINHLSADCHHEQLCPRRFCVRALWYHSRLLSFYFYIYFYSYWPGYYLQARSISDRHGICTFDTCRPISSLLRFDGFKLLRAILMQIKLK